MWRVQPCTPTRAQGGLQRHQISYMLCLCMVSLLKMLFQEATLLNARNSLCLHLLQPLVVPYTGHPGMTNCGT